MSENFFVPISRKAAKPYTCIWCGEKIPQGEKHKQQTAVIDGDFQSSRYHDECFDASGEIDSEDDFFPYGYKRGSTECR